MLRRLKIKHQLYILVFVAVFVIFLVQFLYYVSFSKLTYKRAEAMADQMMEQVAQNVKTMTESIENSARGLSYNQAIQELLVSQNQGKNVELYDLVSQIVSATKASNSNIYGVYWVSSSLRKISDPVRGDDGIVNKLNEKYDFNSDAFTSPVFSTIMKSNSNSLYYYSYLYPVYSIYGTKLSKLGCCIIILDIQELANMVKIHDITENSLFLILDHDNNVIVSNRRLDTGSQYQDVFWNENEQGITRDIMKYDGRKSIVQCRKIEKSDWKIVSVIPMEELAYDMKVIVQTGLLLGFASIAFLIFWGHGMIRSITSPIHTIVDFLAQTKTYLLKQRIERLPQNEIGSIAAHINSMLDKVENMTRKIVQNQTILYEAKLAEQDAELLALQSQINPHFLYNTLNCLSNIGLAYDVAEVADICVAMSNIYRYGIQARTMVSLDEEIQCIKEYLKIMDIRFNGKFETEFRLEDSLLKLQTLRMILQPLVENAVYHGLEQKNEKGKLIIEGRISESGQLVLSVMDDGKAMSRQQLENVRKAIADYEKIGLYSEEKRSIGLSNINKRIKLQFGDAYGIYIESQEMVGTKTTLILPVIEYAAEEVSESEEWYKK